MYKYKYLFENFQIFLAYSDLTPKNSGNTRQGHTTTYCLKQEQDEKSQKDDKRNHQRDFTGIY
jgi:hypothetical protein